MGNASSELLFTAITGNQVQTIRDLLASGQASANARDFFECPALLHACGATDGRVRLGCVAALLQSGADPHVPHPTTGFTAVHYAARMADPRLLRLLLVLQRPHPNSPPAQNPDPKNPPAQNPDPKNPPAQGLSLPPPPIDLCIRTSDSRGDTPLHLAAARAIPSLPILRLLLIHGADPDARNRLGLVPPIPQALLAHIRAMAHDPADDLQPLDPRDTAAIYNPEDSFDPENDPDLQVFFPSLPLHRKAPLEPGKELPLEPDPPVASAVALIGDHAGDADPSVSEDGADQKKESQAECDSESLARGSLDIKERMSAGSHVHVELTPDHEFDSDLDQFIKDAFMIAPQPAQPHLLGDQVGECEPGRVAEDAALDQAPAAVDETARLEPAKVCDEVDVFEKEIEEFEREMQELRSKGYSVGHVVPVTPLDLSESQDLLLLSTPMSRQADKSDPVSNLVIAALPASWQNSPLIQRNLRFFQANYLIGVSVVLFFCFIINPWLILGLLFLSALWLWVIVNQRRRVTMGTERAQETAANVFLIAVTALVLVFFAADPIIFWLMMGVFSLVAIHALIYVPTDR